MLDYLKGTVVHMEETYIVIEVGGIGYRVFCSNPYAFQPMHDNHTVFIHHHVREDAVQLYGFRTRDEQRLFRKLIDVSGIGPRVASGIMSGAQPEAIVAAIQGEDIAFLTTLPGIGRKTAQRLLLELKDKLDDIHAGSLATIDASAEASVASLGGASSDQRWPEAKAALLALGYSESELGQCWAQIRGRISESDSTEHMMKLALQVLFKGS